MIHASRICNFLTAGLIVLCAGAAACQRTAGPPARYFELKGTVVSIDKVGKQIVVNHEAIPGFMGAMTMPYVVKDDAALSQLSSGDQITARVVVTDQGFWLDHIAIQKPSAAPLPRSSPGMPDPAGPMK